MDQLKPFLQGLVKYHFWVLGGLAIVLGLAGWFLATSDLAEQYTKRKTSIENDFNALRTIVGRDDHPNDKIIAVRKTIVGQQHAKVFDAWKFVYDAQQQKNPWPDVLGTDFLEWIKNHGPNDEIPADYRETYQNFIGKHFPKLLELVEVRRMVAPAKAPAAAPGATPAEKPTEASAAKFEGVVDWNDANRKGIEAPYLWSSVPSTLAVRLAQEDVWVYETLLRIIKTTNAGAKDNHTASVKRIDLIEIGQAAAGAWSRSDSFLSKLLGRATGGPSSGSGPSGEGAPPDSGGPPPAPGDGGEPPSADQPGAPVQLDAEAKKLLEKRYVDEKGRPLPAGASDPFKEFRMMPIRLRLLVDQRKVPDLIVQASNSNMPIKAHVVRLNPDAAATSSARSSSGGGPGGAGPGGSVTPDGMGAAMPGGGAAPEPGSGARGSATAASEKSDDSDSVTVEILGVIYIFKPPKLETEAPAAAGPEGPSPAANPDQPAVNPDQPPPAAAPTTPAAAPTTPAAAPATSEPAVPPTAPPAPTNAAPM